MSWLGFVSDGEGGVGVVTGGVTTTGPVGVAQTAAALALSPAAFVALT